MASSKYDYIIVGGGLSGCVLASRLQQYKQGSKILLIEAGQDTRSRPDILQPDILNLGGELDWMYPTEPQASLGDRSIVYNAGKGLGGGTLINSGKFAVPLQRSTPVWLGLSFEFNAVSDMASRRLDPWLGCGLW